MQELIKAQYRNNDLKEAAYETAQKAFAAVPITALTMNDQMLETFCHAIAVTIIEDSAKTMKKNIDDMLSKRGKKISPKDAENIIKEMSWLFLDEMEAAAKVNKIDIKLWALKATIMGAGPERLVSTIQTAWVTKSPPLFTDFNQRIKQAIDGYVNSVFQMLVISNAD